MSGGNVKFSKKAVTVVVLLIFIATYLAGYTLMAHTFFIEFCLATAELPPFKGI